MKPLIYALAGVAVVLALAAGPVAAQGRERPAGSGSGAASGGGEAGVRTGGGASGGGGMSGSGGAVAVPRGSSGSGSSSSGPPSGYSGPQSPGPSGSSGSPYSGGAGRVNPANGNSSYVREMYGSPSDRAVPRGSRPNPGGPVVGQAVPRGGDYYAPGRPPANGGIGYPYYPYYPYYGWAFGLGYYGFYGFYDPWWGWGGAYGGDGYGYGYGSDQGGRGGLKLKVEPTNAEVYVDGYYMGTVDDFDGTFQKLELEVGAHHVEIRAPGYQTIAFDVRIEFGDTVTYRGELQALSKR